MIAGASLFRFSVSSLLLSFLLTACQGPAGESSLRIFKETRLLMGTAVEIQVVAAEESRAREAIRRGFDEIIRIEKKMGWRQAQSDISRINRAAGKQEVTLDQEMFDFLERALNLCSNTEGAFNIAIGPLTRLWNFDAGGENVPEEEFIQERLAAVDFKGIVLDKKKRVVGLPFSGMFLDLGGIAKGYAVDRATEVLKSQGISSGIVDAGGDMRVFGMKPGGELWHLGIRDPSNMDKVLATFRITDRAVVTSGDYERFFIKDGFRYHHIIDPYTGYPARGCRSVTVIAKTAFLADAMATAVFVRGSVKGFRLLQDHSGLEGVIIGSHGEAYVTGDIEKSLVWVGGKPL